jgi:hypothetical protein
MLGGFHPSVENQRRFLVLFLVRTSLVRIAMKTHLTIFIGDENCIVKTTQYLIGHQI